MDYKQAVHWYKKSANQGYASAQFQLAICYHAGTGVNQNLTESILWLTKAATQGHSGAQFLLGSCYQTGDGVEENPQQAIYWFKKTLEHPEQLDAEDISVMKKYIQEHDK